MGIHVYSVILSLLSKSLPISFSPPYPGPSSPTLNMGVKMDYQAMYMSPRKRKVLGDIHNTTTADSPISPTANLKLLTKVASQFDSIENANCYPMSGTPPHPTQVSCEFTSQNQPKGVRKFKSLGFLCDKFLKLYPLDVVEGGDQRSQILLSDLANQLGVEKRRIYDIINVVESLQMATKVGKNLYSWTGRRKLADTLSQLRAYAEQVGLLQYVRMQQYQRKLYLTLKNGELESMESSMFLENSNIASFFRNERRIGILCQKFVMLFLVSLKDGLINLELAAQVLVGDDCSQNKTRLRRLYDIANILVSLGVISRLDLGGGWKKPVFRYAGPPLQHLDNLGGENSVLSDLVKAELSDGISSDLSEDSNGVSWRQDEANSNPVPGTDHSYSLDTSRSAERTAVSKPAAKKRLVFSDSFKVLQSSRIVTMTTAPCVQTVSVAPTKAEPVTRILRVMGQGSKPQPITDGGVYKAVSVGNDIQLIRIDSY
ncbi:positive regulation of DNA endoreduplication [Homalodisca vitripennis]|nr:positive regulation of DNA endoreduplication [Homalodisca vitripennis]